MSPVTGGSEVKGRMAGGGLKGKMRHPYADAWQPLPPGVLRPWAWHTLKIPRSLRTRRHWLLVPLMLLEVSSPLQASSLLPWVSPNSASGLLCSDPSPRLVQPLLLQLHTYNTHLTSSPYLPALNILKPHWKVGRNGLPSCVRPSSRHHLSPELPAKALLPAHMHSEVHPQSGSRGRPLVALPHWAAKELDH